jgi:hydrogenase nickel incorporation protein HypA/HybF
MHEASLMRDLMSQIRKIAEAEKARRVIGVHVWLGALSHMSREHFAEHFVEAAEGSLAEGAELKITLSEDTSDPKAQEIILEDLELETPDS